MSQSFDSFVESPPYDFWECPTYERFESGAPSGPQLFIMRGICAVHTRYGFGYSLDTTSANFNSIGPIGGAHTITAFSVISPPFSLNVPKLFRSYLKQRIYRACAPSFDTELVAISSSDIIDEIDRLGGKMERTRNELVGNAASGSGFPSEAELASWTIESTEFVFTDDGLRYRQILNSGVIYTPQRVYEILVEYENPHTNEQTVSDFVALWDQTASVFDLTDNQFRTYYYSFDDSLVTFITEFSYHFQTINPDEETITPDKTFMNRSAGASSSSNYGIFGGNNVLRRYLCCSDEFRVRGDAYAVYTRTSDADNNTTSLAAERIPNMDGRLYFEGDPEVYQQVKIDVAQNVPGFPDLV